MSSGPTFVKPRRGGAGIPIVNPNTRGPGLVTPSSAARYEIRPPAILPATTAPPLETMGVPVTRNPIPQPRLPVTSHDTVGDDRRLELGFDVYATPFVPQVLLNINQSPGSVVIATPPLKNTELAEHYGHWWLGHGRFPSVPPPASTPPGTSGLTQATYEHYFRALLTSETECQQKENATYSLYAHDVQVKFPTHGDLEAAVCTIIVPGLREYSPYVEENDEVVLRRAKTDGHGRIMGVQHNQYLYDPYSRNGDSQPWDGVEYRGRVTAVVRARETLVVNVDGITRQMAGLQWNTHHNDNTINLKFNIQFPIPEERSRPMRLVLPHIRAALAQSISTTYAQVDGSALEGSDDIHYWVQSMLFPTEADCDAQSNLHSGHFGQRYIDESLNLEQKTAVENICLQNYGTVPYIISGPPGTGKTKTIIEVALQLLKNVAEVSHILVCAPSEPAADTLADRLRHHLQPHEMLRLNRPTRSFNEVPSHLLPYCYHENDRFTLPGFGQLMKYQVVVTSCRDASLLMYARMTNGDLYAAEHGLSARIHPFYTPKPSRVRLHWTALLLDEAAQSTEPEALLPLHVVSPPMTSPKLAFTPLFVMAGDERQLGPRTSSPQTRLQRSLFARLFSMPVYANHPLARGKAGEAPPPLTESMLPIWRPPFTNLIRNYRSHPAILAAPSKLFYFDSLQAEMLQSVLTLAQWDDWKGKRWPILYHNNRSPDDIEGDGGGWINHGEASLALQYATRLSAFLGGLQREICIMSPFKAQVRLLRHKARGKFNLHDVNIGPTEAFQGLEHGVVILCVTRSRKRFVEKDKELNWGIIGQPNKMNVALTRAKYGLIIIGDQDVLVDDPHWRAVLRFCYRSGSVINPQNPEDMLDTKDDELTKFEINSMSKQWVFPEMGDNSATGQVAVRQTANAA